MRGTLICRTIIVFFLTILQKIYVNIMKYIKINKMYVEQGTVNCKLFRTGTLYRYPYRLLT